MLGGNNSKPLLPVFVDDNHLAHNPSNQLQLFVPTGCSVDPVNYFGNDHMTPMLRPNKRVRESEDFNRHQKLQISLNYNIHNEPDRSTSIPNPNAVSTGLRLSYEDDEHNSTVTSPSGSTSLSLGNSIISELDRQKHELDKYIKIQEEHFAKGVKDMKQRHIASFISAIEKGVNKKLQEKDVEIENMNRKNKELLDRIKQVAMEGQNWQYRAKYNESVVNLLKSNLQQAIISQGKNQVKEGFGDSETDDAASYMNTNSYRKISVGPRPLHMTCWMCKVKEVCVLVMPCRHLCLCKDCDLLTSVCPVCQLIKSSSVQVYLS